MKKFLFCCLLLVSYFFYGQKDSIPFTLGNAIDTALVKNRQIINSNREIAKSKKQRWETIAQGLPQVSGQVDYQNQLRQPVSLVPGEIAGGEPGTFVPLVFGQPQQLGATATLEQLIFDGSYIVGVQASKAFAEYSENLLEKTTSDIRKMVATNYLNALLAIKSVAIMRKNLEVAKRDLYEVTEIFNNGFEEAETVEQLRITLNRTESRLANALRLQKTTLQMLNFVMGVELDNPTKLVNSLEQMAEYGISKEFVDKNLSAEANVDVKIATNLKSQRFFERKLEKSKSLPRITTFLNYGSTAFNDDFAFFSDDQEWFDSSILGVRLSLPIFSSFQRKSRIQRASLALEQAETSLEDAIISVHLEYDQKKSEHILAIEELRNSEENLLLSEKIANKNRIKFFEGIASNQEYRQARFQLYRSQEFHLQALQKVFETALDTEILRGDPINFDLPAINKLQDAHSVQLMEYQIEDSLMVKRVNASSRNMFKQKADSVPAISRSDKLAGQTVTADPIVAENKNDSFVAEPRNVKGVAAGYYLVANVFSKRGNHIEFLSSLKEMDIAAESFRSPDNGLYYVYLKKYPNEQTAIDALGTQFGGLYKERLWILWIQ